MKRWNWIDLLIVLFLIAAIALVAGKFMGNDEDLVDEPIDELVTTVTDPDLRIVVSCDNISRELAENIVSKLESEPRVMDGKTVERTHLLSGSALINGHVRHWEICDTADEQLVNLLLTVEADSLLSGYLTLIGVQEVRLGKSFFVKTIDVEISGTIISLTELTK